jgi:hypothetical protein
VRVEGFANLHGGSSGHFPAVTGDLPRCLSAVLFAREQIIVLSESGIEAEDVAGVVLIS